MWTLFTYICKVQSPDNTRYQVKSSSNLLSSNNFRALKHPKSQNSDANNFLKIKTNFDVVWQIGVWNLRSFSKWRRSCMLDMFRKMLWILYERSFLFIYKVTKCVGKKMFLRFRSPVSVSTATMFSKHVRKVREALFLSLKMDRISISRFTLNSAPL